LTTGQGILEKVVTKVPQVELVIIRRILYNKVTLNICQGKDTKKEGWIL
jgi:hypothetical protein